MYSAEILKMKIIMQCVECDCINTSLNVLHNKFTIDGRDMQRINKNILIGLILLHIYYKSDKEMDINIK